jgi:glycerol-3-phosphate dehydrogenase
MNRQISALAGQTFDVLVIGGGILGAGIARDATLRGLNVALVEKSDFASGTSSRSTKLIHGGFRYLEHGEFRLVSEACHERAVLQRQAPHLVKPRSFLLPVYEQDPRPLWKIRIGMMLYDLLAGKELGRPHQVLSIEETLRQEPLLPREGLRGCVLFDDCQMDDAKLCLETVLDAAKRGATCVNYCEVLGAERLRERITRVQLCDVLTGKQFNVRAQVFINAAGPWIESVVGLAAWDTQSVALSPTKGVHLILPNITREHGIFFQSRFDDRMLFLIPWFGYSMLGTTDTNYRGDPTMARADRDDVDYLLGRLHEVLPDCSTGPEHVLASFAGIRPLLQANRQRPSSRSREFRLVQLGENFLTIAGGKYTTFRTIADRVVRKLFRILGHQAPACKTGDTPLVERRTIDPGKPIANSPPIHEGDIIRACDEEMAMTVADVMRRRTKLALSPAGGPETADRISRIMALPLGWDEKSREESVRQYRVEWERNREWMVER